MPSPAIVNSAAMNIEVHVWFQINVFIFFRYIPESGIFLVFWFFLKKTLILEELEM